MYVCTGDSNKVTKQLSKGLIRGCLFQLMYADVERPSYIYLCNLIKTSHQHTTRVMSTKAFPNYNLFFIHNLKKIFGQTIQYSRANC